MPHAAIAESSIIRIIIIVRIKNQKEMQKNILDNFSRSKIKVCFNDFQQVGI